MALFVVHYSEVALKGRNRPEFLRVLRKNLSRTLAVHRPSVTLKDGRFLVEAGGDPEEVSQKLARVFGVAWFSQAALVPRDYASISGEVLSQARGSPRRSFRISPRRSDKSFSISSAELASRLGKEVADGTGMKVELRDPGLDLHVDVIRSGALVYSSKVPGPGGLPVGTAGRVMLLFSGGIDSPVASWLLMKRGCRPVYVHFYLAPAPEAVLDSKITKLLKVLASYGGRSTMVLVPFAEYQMATMGSPPGLEPSLFRRFMRMTAEALAPRFRAAAIATGDSLSQAASQTLWNLATFDDGSTLPVLRPLLTYDKEDIVDLGRRVGTYELSLEDYKDCCAIVTRRPQTRAKSEVISQYAREFGFADLVPRSIDGGTLVTWDPRTARMKASGLAGALEEPGSEAPSPTTDGTKL